MRPAARFGIVAALALSACAGGDDPQEVLGTLERDRLELIAESNERLVELFVEEGDRVTAGALLARQEAGAMEPRLAQSRASLAEAERRLGDLSRGPALARDRRSARDAEGRREHPHHGATRIPARRRSGRAKTAFRVQTWTRRVRDAMPRRRRATRRAPGCGCSRKARGPSSSRRPAPRSTAPRRRWPSSWCPRNATACGRRGRV